VAVDGGASVRHRVCESEEGEDGEAKMEDASPATATCEIRSAMARGVGATGGDGVGMRWAVTGAVHVHAVPATRVCGQKAFWATERWADPISILFQYLKSIQNSKSRPSLGPKIFKRCKGLDLNLVNKLSHWPNFKFPLDLML
jgi:hypothetical protein